MPAVMNKAMTTNGDENRADGLFVVLVLPRAQILRHHNGRALAQADDEECDHIHDLAALRDARNGSLPEKRATISVSKMP
jgi:hypothetical protein